MFGNFHCLICGKSTVQDVGNGLMVLKGTLINVNDASRRGKEPYLWERYFY